MNWTRIIAAANGRPQSLAWVVRRGPDADVAALTTLLLLDDAPHPAAALSVAATSAFRRGATPIHAALAPHVAPALAAWRADPQWHERAIGADVGRNLARGVAVMCDALRNDPAALHDAVAIVVRADDPWSIGIRLEAFGAAGRRALGDDLRAVLLARADPALRKRLIDAAVRDPFWIRITAPAWAGMTDDERELLASAAMACDDASAAFRLLDDLGAAGRGALSADLRAALERRAMEHPDAWRVLAWRAADAGWTALTADERDAVLAAAERPPWNVPLLLRTVGVAGWNAMRADERARMAVAVRHALANLFTCPPALWPDLVGADLPPATEILWTTPGSWRAEDADADLGGLPPSHQTIVLALAPWRSEDATKDSSRMQRLRAAWDALTVDERVALATAAPGVLPPVAAAARLAGGATAAGAAVGATVVRVATATDGAAAKRAVGVMLRAPADWRAWMSSFAPTDGDPSAVWDAWRRAVRRGFIPDSAVCARLAAPRDLDSRGAARRAGR